MGSMGTKMMCPAREGGWGQGSHHSPAVALARPAGPILCHEGPLTETCQLFSYLKRDKVRLVMTTRLARITSEPGMKHKLAQFLFQAWNSPSKHPHPAVALARLTNQLVTPMALD